LNVKQIKFLSWQSFIANKIEFIRDKEFGMITKMKILDALCVIFWAATSVAISTVCFSLFYYENGNFSGLNVFTVVYLF